MSVHVKAHATSIRLGILLFCALAASCLFLAVPATAADEAAVLTSGSASAVSVAEVRNTTEGTIAINWDAAPDADGARVTATMSYGGTVTRSKTSTVSRSGSASSGSYPFDFGTYGRFDVSVQFTKGGSNVGSPVSTQAAVVADTYNIAPVSATLPVTFFSLNLWGEGNIRESGPVILLLERPNAYNWDNLPQGCYPLPYLSDAQIRNQPDVSQAGLQFISREQIVTDYVADLLSLDPTSHINLYCVDYYVDLIQRVIYANKIPADQYHVTVISDGAYTYSVFKRTYDAASAPASTHAALVKEWKADKDYAYKNSEPAAKYFDSEGNATYGFGRLFWAAVDSDPNVEMWVARKDQLATASDGGTFGASVQGSSKITQPSIAALLESNIASSSANTAAFKALYNFNDSYFADAQAAGKDVMVLLGARVSGEADFEAYARFVQAYYGDAYAYYYKGHPATPTGSYPEKQAQLGRLGVTDVDSSVAAELILFFNPEIYLSGYASSTYASVPTGMGKGMFNMTKATGLANDLYKNMEFWASKVTDATPSGARALCTAGHDNYLVEFNDAIVKEKGYDIAIWDATDAKIIYYKLGVDGNYHTLDWNGVVEDGYYRIRSRIDSSLVLDMDGYKRANGTNLQVWRDAASANQLFKVERLKNGRYAVTSAWCGHALDLDRGSRKSGANVQFWEAAPTSPIQQWAISLQKGGTYKLTNVASKTVLDLSGARAVNGRNVWGWADNGTDAQRWLLERVEDPWGSLDAAAAENRSALADGTYVVLDAKSTSFALDVRYGSAANGANVWLYAANGTPAQQWKVSHDEAGYVTLTCVGTGKALDVAAGMPRPGANVGQYAPNGTRAQKWVVATSEDGSFEVASALYPGISLDVKAGNIASRANVQVYAANGTPAQRFAFSDAS